MLKKGDRKSTIDLKANDMMEGQAGNKLIEFGRQQQCEANKKLSEISRERDKVESQLFKVSKTRKFKP